MTDAAPSHRPKINISWITEYGMSWTPEGESSGERHSHALRHGDDVWLIDPVDCSDIDEALAQLGGTIQHVVVLLDRHQRDSQAIAKRYGATLHVVAGASFQDIPGDAQRFDEELAGSPFEVLGVRDTGRLWHERALWWPEHELLVIPESLGSADMFTLGTDTAIAVHPMLRFAPPRTAFDGVQPRTILFGHGRPVTKDAAETIAAAIEESRRKTPSLVMGMAKQAVSALRSK